MIDIDHIPDEDVVDDNVIVEVQKHRLAILRGDLSVNRNTLMLMDSLTVTALANKKIVVEGEASEKSTDVVLQLTKEIMALKHNPFQTNQSGELKPPDLPNITLVEGEMD